MINILSYVGMNQQAEVCLWTLLGLIRTIFDATLFKVNANLKQVWQMSMPSELSLPVQRGLRTMISGVMLVQCFTVYVYLASYIVLLYPVFLEERPTLVLPWLLLAAIRNLLCELTSLALGLGTCVLLGAARPPCVKFLISKMISIMPAFYMWMLVLSYYHTLKVAAAFKIFSAALPPTEHDYGLELAIRRRRTKSLLDEEQLRNKLVTTYYSQPLRQSSNTELNQMKIDYSSRLRQSLHSNNDDDDKGDYEAIPPLTTSNRMTSDIGSYEEWLGSEVTIPRDTDRILEQFGVMMLRIGEYIKKERTSSLQILDSSSFPVVPNLDGIDCTTLQAQDTETPPHVSTSKRKVASYLQEYPQIFMKKHSEIPLRIHSEDKVNIPASKNESGVNNNAMKYLQTPSAISYDKISDIEDIAKRSKANGLDISYTRARSNSTVSFRDKQPKEITKYKDNSDSKTKKTERKSANIKKHSNSGNKMQSSASTSRTQMPLNGESIKKERIENKSRRESATNSIQRNSDNSSKVSFHNNVADTSNENSTDSKKNAKKSNKKNE